MATRLYFPATSTVPAGLAPAFDSQWEYTTEAVRGMLNTTKGSTPITIGTRNGAFTIHALDRQYISPPLIAQTFSGSASLQAMSREYNNGDDIKFPLVTIRLVSYDGAELKSHLINFQGAQIINVEFINNVSHRNVTYLLNNSLSANVTCQTGDRLIVEVGYQCDVVTGATPEASIKWGENATDLPVNETQTTDGAPWIEFTNDIQFIPDGIPLNILSDNN